MAIEIPKITLNKDQQQKIALSFLLLCFVIYGYFSFLLNPLQASAVRAEAESVGLEKKLAEANGKLRTFGELKAKAAASGGLIAQAQAFIPEGAPIAWYPPRLRSFFSRHGLTNVTVTLKGNDTTGDRDLDKKFTASNWNVQIPSAEFFPLGIALAGLENEEVLSEITALTISTRENPEQVQVSMDLQTILKAQ